MEVCDNPDCNNVIENQRGTWKNGNMFCGKQCKLRYVNRDKIEGSMHECSLEPCSEEFHRPPSKERDGPMFCCNKHKHLYFMQERNEHETFECANCGSMGSRRPSKLNEERNFCDADCYHEWLKG